MRRNPDKCRRCRFGHIVVTSAKNLMKGWEATCLFCGYVDYLKDLGGRARGAGQSPPTPTGDAAA